MSFLLDTNILSAHLRRAGTLAHRFFQHSGRLHTSSICLGELHVWICGRKDPAPLEAAVDRLLEHEVQVLDFDRACAVQFGRTRVQLRRSGIEVNTTDLMIASTALVFNLTLVTHNTADFKNIPGLNLEDWLTP